MNFSSNILINLYLKKKTQTHNPLRVLDLIINDNADYCIFPTNRTKSKLLIEFIFIYLLYVYNFYYFLVYYFWFYF